MKTLQQIQQLAKNPFYVLSDDEIAVLKAHHQFTKTDGKVESFKNKNIVSKNDTEFEKNNTEIPEVDQENEQQKEEE
jgi:hypothetical protein